MATSAENELFIIGVGASAGGIEATAHLLSAVEGKENCCFVILQHLSPKYNSNLTSILQRYTSWEVRAISNMLKPEPLNIYITPPGHNLKFKNNHLLLEKISNSKIAPSIDTFLTSLAAEKASKAVSVILSGTGNDGAAGIKIR